MTAKSEGGKLHDNTLPGANTSHASCRTHITTTPDHLPITGKVQVLARLPTFIVVAVDAGNGNHLPVAAVLFAAARCHAIHCRGPNLRLCLLPAGCRTRGRNFVGQYGRRRVLIVSQIGTLAGFVLLASANSLILVFLRRIIDGLTSGNISVAHAYAAERSAPSARKQALGTTSGAIGTGLLLGPALSGFLVHFGVTTPIWAAAALSLISIVATIMLLPSDAPASGLLDPRCDIPLQPKGTGLLLLLPDAWSVLGLLVLFYSPTRCSYLRLLYSLLLASTGKRLPSGPGNSAPCSSTPVRPTSSSRAS